MNAAKDNHDAQNQKCKSPTPAFLLIEVPACANDEEDCEQWEWLRWFWGNRNRKNAAEAWDTVSSSSRAAG